MVCNFFVNSNKKLKAEKALNYMYIPVKKTRMAKIQNLMLSFFFFNNVALNKGKVNDS